MNNLPSFLISNENAPGPGFGLFSPTHFLILAILAVMSALIIRHYKQLSVKNRIKMRRVLAGIILFLEFGKDVALALTGQFQMVNWPFQLCGLAVFIVAFDAWHRGKTTEALLYSLTLPGAAMAVITPDWTTNNAIDVFVWQSFVIHALLVAYVLMALFAREFRPDWRQLWRVVIFLLAVTPFCAWLNHIWHQNFMYLEIPAPGSPLTFVHDIFGRFYLLGMVLLVSTFWFFMYLPWVVSERNKPKKSTKKTTKK